jgi:hypothetical protein
MESAFLIVVVGVLKVGASLVRFARAAVHNRTDIGKVPIHGQTYSNRSS